VQELEVSIHLASKGVAIHCFGGFFGQCYDSPTGKRAKTTTSNKRGGDSNIKHLVFYLLYDVAKCNLQQHVEQLSACSTAATAPPLEGWIEKLRLMEKLGRCIR
jgi:hypothetical protein